MLNKLGEVDGLRASLESDVNDLRKIINTKASKNAVIDGQ